MYLRLPHTAVIYRNLDDAYDAEDNVWSFIAVVKAAIMPPSLAMQFLPAFDGYFKAGGMLGLGYRAKYAEGCQVEDIWRVDNTDYLVKQVMGLSPLYVLLELRDGLVKVSDTDQREWGSDFGIGFG